MRCVVKCRRPSITADSSDRVASIRATLRDIDLAQIAHLTSSPALEEKQIHRPVIVLDRSLTACYGEVVMEVHVLE